MKGLSPNQAIFSTFSLKVHYHINNSDSKLQEEFFESLVHIFTPTNQGLIKGLSPNQAICGSSPLEMYHFVMHYGSKA